MAEPAGLLLSDDLVFTSRVTGTARDLDLTVHAAASVERLLSLAGQQAPSCVLVDLNFPGLALPDLLGRLAAVCAPPPRVVGYGSHVDAAGLRAAREAGCDPVLPRSQFVEDLPRELPGWLSRKPG